MPEKIVELESKSWQKGGEAEREKNLKKAMESAGCEVVKPPPEPTVEDRLRENYTSQIPAAIERHPDWQEVVGQDNIVIGRPAQLAICELENACEVVYHLGRNPVLATSIGQMSAPDAVAAIQQLGAKLASNASFDEIARRPNYWGKARALRASLLRRRMNV